MIKKNYKSQYGDYISNFKIFLKNHYSYDNSTLIFSNRFNQASFSITRPIDSYTNCQYINGYPHFQVPVETCIEEILTFIENQPIYSDNYCIRYGDTHPNKPIPMLAQVRNLIIADIFDSLISTKGNKKQIYTIGDISEKSIKAFVQQNFNDNQEQIFNIIFSNIMKNTRSENNYMRNYKVYCEDVKTIITSLLQQLHLNNGNYLLESELYSDRKLYDYIRNNLTYDDGIKQNGEIKYFLQELMFILNSRFDNYKIYNIIGSDQSDHIRKVFKVLEENDLNIDVSFLTYAICKNAVSRNIDEWETGLQNYIESNNLKIGGNKICYQDFLKMLICGYSNNQIIDYSNITQSKQIITMYNEIYTSIINAHNKLLYSNINKICPSKLLYNMTLVKQQLDITIVSGEQRKFLDYLYKLAKEFNSKLENYENISEMYLLFIIKGLEQLSLSNTQVFGKILEKRRK